jgi:hypothetical protein
MALGQRSSGAGVLEGRKSGVGHDQLKVARRTPNVAGRRAVDDLDIASELCPVAEEQTFP